MAKRGQGEGTAITYLPDKKLYHARLTIGKDKNGKQKRKAYYGKTKKEVQEKLNEAKAALDKGVYVNPSRLTVSRWMDIWLSEYKRRFVRHNTYFSLCSQTERNIKPRLGDVKLKDLRSDMVQKFVNDLSDSGLSPGSVERAYFALRGALKQAFINELIPRDPTLNIKLPEKERKAIRVLTAEEQARFIKIAPKYKYGEIFIAALGTGMRKGELLALTWDDVDFDNATIRVNKTQTRTKDYYDKQTKEKLVSTPPKTKSSFRSVPMLPGLVPIFRELQEKQGIGKIIYHGDYIDNNLVFCTCCGKPIYPQSIESMFHGIAAEAGIDGIHIHCLRHTFATRGLENGIEMRVMQDLLGHASIKMTADLYTHVLPEKKQDSIMKMADTIIQ